MGRVKVKDIEGNETDLRKLFGKTDWDISSYLGVKPVCKKIPHKWIVLMAALFFVLACCLYVDLFNTVWMKIGVLALFMLGAMIVYCVHYNLERWSLTAIAGFAVFIFILMVLHIYTPEEIAKKMEAPLLKSIPSNEESATRRSK